jgi:protein-histidine N-methyltransferase
LPRRELFDVKLQLLSEDGAEEAAQYADIPSDLVNGVYEGGLKTWECSIDLARYIFDSCEDHAHHRVLEVIHLQVLSQD